MYIVSVNGHGDAVTMVEHECFLQSRPKKSSIYKEKEEILILKYLTGPQTL